MRIESESERARVSRHGLKGTSSATDIEAFSPRSQKSAISAEASRDYELERCRIIVPGWALTRHKMTVANRRPARPGGSTGTSHARRCVGLGGTPRRAWAPPIDYRDSLPSCLTNH
jgi:hypothetical protein